MCRAPGRRSRRELRREKPRNYLNRKGETWSIRRSSGPRITRSGAPTRWGKAPFSSRRGCSSVSTASSRGSFMPCIPTPGWTRSIRWSKAKGSSCSRVENYRSRPVSWSLLPKEYPTASAIPALAGCSFWQYSPPRRDQNATLCVLTLFSTMRRGSPAISGGLCSSGRGGGSLDHDLLHAPVVHVGDVNRVLVRARQAVRPIELAHVVARLSEHADDLSVERHLVQPPGLRIRHEQVLRRRLRHAERPRRALVGHGRRPVAEHRMAALVVGRVEEQEVLEVAVGVEHLDAPVAAVGDVDVVVAIDGDVVRVADHAGVLVRMVAAAAERTPRLHPVAALVELGDARVHVAVADVDVVLRIPRHAGRACEQSLRRARVGLRRPLVAPAVVALG